MTGKRKAALREAAGKVECMVGYGNYTMTEAEAMQAARENMTYIEQLDHLIWSIVRDEGDFYEARKIALERAEKEGDDFRERPQSEVKYPLASTLASCFPELTEKNIAAILKWKRRREKKNRSWGKNYFKIFGEAHQLTNRSVSRPSTDREDAPEDWKNYDSAFSAFFRMVERKTPMRSNAIVARTFNRTSRAHRSPVRSAAKSGDDSGGDGESDQGEPPRPYLTVPSLHSIPFNQKLNRFLFPRVFPPCRWSMSGRWAA